MDPISLIISALAAGAVAGAEGTATQVVKDAYSGLKAAVKRRFAGRPSGETALEQHVAHPEAWHGALEAELLDADAGHDPDVVDAAQRLMALLDSASALTGQCQVNLYGTGTGVQIGDNNEQTNSFGIPPSA